MQIDVKFHSSVKESKNNFYALGITTWTSLTNDHPSVARKYIRLIQYWLPWSILSQWTVTSLTGSQSPGSKGAGIRECWTVNRKLRWNICFCFETQLLRRCWNDWLAHAMNFIATLSIHGEKLIRHFQRWHIHVATSHLGLVYDHCICGFDHARNEFSTPANLATRKLLWSKHTSKTCISWCRDRESCETSRNRTISDEQNRRRKHQK